MGKFNWGRPEDANLPLPNTFFDVLHELTTEHELKIVFYVVIETYKDGTINTNRRFTKKELIEKTGANPASFKLGIKKAIEHGFITEERSAYTDEQAVEIIKRKTSQTFAGFEQVCEWCKGTTVILHDHHYPVRKRDNGSETVKICPNCHTEFHHLTDYPATSYRLTRKLEIPTNRQCEQKSHGE